MDEVMAIWAQWVKPSAGLPTVQWSLLLAAAACAGHLLQRYSGLPKVVGYSLVGTLAGLAGFPAGWPLQGVALFLLELGVSLVLFEAGGRIALRWFRHNPMVLLQSLLEATLTAVAVYYVLRWLDVRASVAEAMALISMAASPAVLSRVIMDTRAAGPVTERAMVLATLNTFYALTLVSARVGTMHVEDTDLVGTLYPVAVVLGISVVVGAVLSLVLRSALRFMSPTSENTSIVMISLIAAAAAMAAHFGGSAPLAALLGGLLLKQLHPRPWAWPRQLGTAASLLTMLMFVLVSVVAAKADWNPAVAGLVAALVLTRGVAKVAGISLANFGSGTSLKQAFWTGCTMAPMSSVALLMVSQFVASSLTLGPRIASIALPAILLMEILGAIITTFAIYQAGESLKPWMPVGATDGGEQRG
ncbi:MAG: rane efflux protein-like protein [Ramlibacter sp.]|jgi:Kef-type K+ transport system membrane component KefB|uniref:cation:proton antiporter n=1 Tax=Ramlibacter sp. TaxID=1917967 RepID=UPI0026377C77|nr:cation:proton antiporter [Ramlibacter sp.]MDB5750943.1 rane efflux protein-like protein [Ramlibacter sp.]